MKWSETLSDPGDTWRTSFLHLQNVIARAINEGPASPASSRRLSGALLPLGAPAARRTRRQACLAGCAHRSVRRHAADALRHLACLRAAGLAAARAAIMMGARTARRRRVLLSAAPLGAHAPAGAGGGCSERAERRPGARLADGRGGRGPRERGASCMAQSTLRPTTPPHAGEEWAAVGLGCGTRGGPVGAGGGMEVQPRPCCCAPAAGAGGPPRLALGGGAAPPAGGKPRPAVAAGPWFGGDVPSAPGL